MNTIVRWGKFNLVGAVGMAVQLGALALINRLAPGHYMLATAAAIEITLLHNFVWHLHYTWRDRSALSTLRMGARPRASWAFDPVSSVERAGFHGGKSGADAGAGGGQRGFPSWRRMPSRFSAARS